MIFVSVGTYKKGFDRLIKEIDLLKEKKLIKEEIIAQIGHGKYIPKNIKYEKFFEEEEMEKNIKKCTIYITHAGVGSVMKGLNFGKKIIILPRLKKFDEAVDDHQIEIAEKLSGKIIYCKNEKEIKKAIGKQIIIKKRKKNNKIIEILDDYVIGIDKK
jgi:UDP-N-acetylglucosamine transferase subunit ALG13